MCAHGAKVAVWSCDITNVERVKEVTELIVGQYGRIDCLVCSAGMSNPAEFMSTTPEKFQQILNLNVVGCVIPTQAMLPHMKKQGGGRLLYVSSQAGQVGIYGFSAYSASKFALRGFAEALQMEVLADNIRVSLLFPPDTDTPMLAEENKQKPAITAKLSETAGLFSAEAVATDAVNGMCKGSFFISTGLEGWMLSVASAGMSPITSMGRLITEIVLLPITRIVAFVVMLDWNRTIRSETAKLQKAK